MKHYSILSNVTLRTAFLIFSILTLQILSSPLLALAEPPQIAATSLRERAMNAAQQLREYRKSILVSKQKMKDISSVHAEVGLRINNATTTSSTIFFYDNMESGVNNWTTQSYTGSDLLHQTTLNASSATHSWWSGIELQSNYDNGTRINNAVISPSIDLTTTAAPISLLFAENYVTEQGWDYCMVDVTTDGGTIWSNLRGGYGSAPTGSSDGWTITSLDLSSYAGQTINLRYYFDTGDEQFNEFPGWFVDDVVIFDQGGQITGKKFFDVNNNGAKDIGERGVKNWLITATGPVTFTTKTNYRGRYWFTLPLGSYTLSETFQPNWTQTYPPTGTWSLTLSTPDTLIDSVHFGNYINASFINGKKFHDLDQDGLFNNADTVLPEWKILLCDTSGNQIDFDRTDSIGEYSLYVFEPGTYVVKEVDKSGWLQTAPATEWYRITIPDLSTDSNGNDFGNYFSPLTNSILGLKFNDRDRNGSFDVSEQGVGGFKIQLYRKGNGNNYNLFKTRTSDSSGFYQFLSLPADTYRVKEVPNQGWWQSYPESFHALILNNGETHDSVDFGNYEIIPGSVNGMKYSDVNNNGSKDTPENGLSGWHVLITGSTYFNAAVSLDVTTDGNGDYSFAGIWPGSYIVSEVWRSGWRQTEPANLAPHFVNLNVEENRSGVNFGNILDSTFSTSFRTFKAESLAFAVDGKNQHKPIKRAANKVQFWVTFVNETTLPVSKLTAKLAVPLIDSLTSTKLGIALYSTKKNRVDITFESPIAPGDSVMLCGFGQKPKPQVVTKWWWIFSDLTKSPVHALQPLTYYLCWPMPNALNLLEDAGVGLKVGLGGPHTVVHPSWKEIVKSLFIKPDRIHIGDARCLDKFAGTTMSIKRQQKYLSPTRGNNKLFAELLALQANIRGSDLLVLPGGFGNLVFDDTTGGGSVLNGLTIREIAAKADSFMSSYKDTVPSIPCAMPAGLAGLSPESLYEKVRKINCAFSGVIDTIEFATGLKFAPVAPLSSVPFLRYDPLAAQRVGFTPTAPLEGYVPDVFALHQNYPNPFNPSTTVSFVLSHPSLVTIKIYNILGQEVVTLLDRQEFEDGDQEVYFNAGNLPSGIYFYHLRAEGIADENEGIVGQTYTAVRKMLLLK